MKAIVLLATLKKEGLSNTATLVQFLTGKMEAQQISCETIKLVEENILPGTYSNMGPGDAWPAILEKITAADILVFATPIWWGNHASQMQQVIERLDEIHDGILKGETSRLDGKAGGIVITGDSDGAQHIIGNFSNFLNAVGVIVPPFATLSVLWEGQRKGAETTAPALLAEYEKHYSKTADTMVSQLKKFAVLPR